MRTSEIKKNHFRVAVFGSARIRKGDARYKQVYTLARLIAKEGFDLVTGGGPGLMDAASRGYHECKKAQRNNNIHSIGLIIKLPQEQRDAYHLDIQKDFNRFSGRLDTFMELSNAVVVASGGIGTLLELFYTWQLLQVKHICEMPIILLGRHWNGLLHWIQKELLRKNMMSTADFRNIFVVKNNQEAIHIIQRVHEDAKTMKHVCKNFEKYRRTG